MTDPSDVDAMLTEQRDYYRARAAEYDEWWTRTGTAFRSEANTAAWEQEAAETRRWLDQRNVGGDVLELAGGTGNWTAELERRASRLTVVDSSPETLAISRTKLADPDAVDYVVADIFTFDPPRRFDIVFFSFWLSHVPAERFDCFWTLVDRCLAPGGRVLTIDSAHPSVMQYAPDSGIAARPVGGYRGHQGAIADDIAERVLADGSRYRIVKRFWLPDDLEAEMSALGWQATASSTEYFFLLAEFERA